MYNCIDHNGHVQWRNGVYIHYAALAVARIFFTVLAYPCCSWHITELHDLLFSKASWLMTD